MSDEVDRGISSALEKGIAFRHDWQPRTQPNYNRLKKALRMVLLLAATIFYIISLYRRNLLNLLEPSTTTVNSQGLSSITQMISEGKLRAALMHKNESKNFSEAVSNYKIRYKRNPPRGFDAWYTYAKAHGVQIIDDYDTISEDLEPFRHLTPAELSHRANLLVPRQGQERNMINAIRIENGEINVVTEDDSDPVWNRRAESLSNMLKAVKYNFTDMTLPVNEDAPPRVLISDETRKRCEYQSPQCDRRIKAAPFVSHGKNSLFEHIRRSCSSESPMSRGEPPSFSDDADISFVKDLSGETDICSRTDIPLYHSAYRQQWWTTIPELFPLFSYGTTSVHSDIRIPAMMFYFSDDQLPTQTTYQFEPSRDVMWEKKKPSLFWRGRTTDGVVDDYDFSAQHRHRLVDMAHQSEGSVKISAMAQDNASEAVILSQVDVNAALFNVWFTRAMTGNRTCSSTKDLDCIRVKNDHAFLNQWSDHHDSWQYKFLADLDGYGYSAKFRGLLASTSVPIKATLYKEYFNNYLVPWVHYVPMSHSMLELRNILSYFTGLKGLGLQKYIDHDEEAREIAEAGALWVKNHMRREDMIAFTFRLALEWARLCAHDRSSMDYIEVA